MTCSSLNSVDWKVWENILNFVNHRKRNKDFLRKEIHKKLEDVEFDQLKSSRLFKKDLAQKLIENILENIKKNEMSIYKATKIISEYVKKINSLIIDFYLFCVLNIEW